MKEIVFEIEGIVPILFNRFTEAAIAGLVSKSSKRKTTSKNDRELAETKVYRNGDGFLVLPAAHIKKCLLTGSSMATQKVGKKSAEMFIRATVFPSQELHLFYRAAGNEKSGKIVGIKEPDGIDARTAVNHNAGGKGGVRVMVYRPYLEAGWRLKIGLKLLDERIGPDMVTVAMEEAGLLVGLCAHRPEFGRFRVITSNLVQSPA